jgi:beta-glucosidase
VIYFVGVGRGWRNPDTPALRGANVIQRSSESEDRFLNGAEMRVYVDGVADPVQVERPGDIDSNGADLALGIAQYPFPGELDEVRVTNRGSHTAEEVVQLYTTQRNSRTRQPEQVLRGFGRVRLEAGEDTTVEFEVQYDDFSFWDITQNEYVVERSPHDVWLGSSAHDIRVEGVLHVRGEEIGQRDLSTPTRAVDADDWNWSEVELLDKSKSDGMVVGMTDGSWVSFADVDLRDKPDTALLSVARAADGAVDLELRRQSPSGQLLGTVSVPSTGDVYSYTERTADLRNATGNNQTVYLVARGEMRVNTVQFQSAETATSTEGE